MSNDFRIFSFGWTFLFRSFCAELYFNRKDEKLLTGKKNGLSNEMLKCNKGKYDLKRKSLVDFELRKWERVGKRKTIR